MGGNHPIVEGAVTIGALIVGVACLALILSPKAQTAKVIQATASGFSNALGVAESPVTGETYKIDLSYPDEGFGMGTFGMGAGLPTLN